MRVPLDHLEAQLSITRYSRKELPNNGAGHAEIQCLLRFADLQGAVAEMTTAQNKTTRGQLSRPRVVSTMVNVRALVRDFDAARRGLRLLRNRNLEHAVLARCGDAFRVGAIRQRETALEGAIA